MADDTVTDEAETSAAGGAGTVGENGTMLKVTQVASPIGRKPYQRKNLIGLGLNKMHRSRILQDIPEVRGMIERVKHLVKVEPVDGSDA